MHEDVPRIKPNILIALGAGLGIAMIAIGIGWGAVIRGRALMPLFPPAPWADLLLGAAVGAAFAGMEWLIFRHTHILRAEVAMLDAILNLPALRWRHVILLSLVAAIPEEFLFRGALQPDLGWLGAALLFGAAHAISWQYTVDAVVAGAVLGLLMVWTGNLWAPIAAHATIDAVMLAVLIRQRPPGGWQPL